MTIEQGLQVVTDANERINEILSACKELPYYEAQKMTITLSGSRFELGGEMWTHKINEFNIKDLPVLLRPKNQKEKILDFLYNCLTDNQKISLSKAVGEENILFKAPFICDLNSKEPRADAVKVEIVITGGMITKE